MNLRALGVHILVTLVAAGTVTYFVDLTAAITLCIGSLISTVTLVSVIWSTSRLFAQKPIALTALAIVIKYALIGAILLYVTQHTEWSVLWLGLGVGLILPTLSISGFFAVRGEDIGP